MDGVAQKQQQHKRNRANRVAVLLTLLAAALRWPLLSTHSIAFDEGYSLAVGRSDWSVLFQAVLQDGVHPPLFYMFFKLALALYGDSVFGARFFTAALSVLGVPLLYHLARRLYDRRVALAAALLLSLNPVHIWLAQEARMYSLLSALVCLNMIFFWAFLNRPAHRPWLYRSGLAISAALIYLLHYFGLTVAILQFLILLLFFRRYHRRLVPWTGVQLVAGLALLPWLILTALRDVPSFGIGFLVQPTSRDPWLTLWNFALGLAPHLPWLSAGGLILIGLGVVLSGRHAQPKAAHRLLLLWALFPIALVWLMSQTRSFYADRYFSFVIPALLLLVALGLVRGLPQPWAAITLASLSIITLTQHTFLFTHPTFTKDTWREAVAYIADRDRADDIVLLRSPHIALPFGYYYDDEAEIRLASFNQDAFNLDEVVPPNRRVWVVMPYTRRPTHYPMQPLTSASVWALDPDAANLAEYVNTHRDDIVDNQHFLGMELWLIDPTPRTP